MKNIIYIDRQTGRQEIEKVYGWKSLQILYGGNFFSRILSSALLPLVSRFPFFSAVYGTFQKSPRSVKKIVPFIKEFGVNTDEFLEPISSFRSFNDFFIRRLKPEARPLDMDPEVVVIPADGRYYFYQEIDEFFEFNVKGERFSLLSLLGDPELAEYYVGGSMLIARLCPHDYHRFHFPCDCLPGESRLINGWLYSVNPIALRKNIAILSQNKRRVCELQTERFGKVAYIEIGATCVGTICETYIPNTYQRKGAEKGYFEFGASSLILLFAKGAVKFDEELLAATKKGLEVRCLLGQRMGRLNSD